jgi:cysteine synthase
VAILPEGMSRERFDWLEAWCASPADDIIRTPGTESNVKEIYDACAALEQEPGNVILNQFAEFGNHLGHYAVTGRALEAVVEAVRAGHPGLRAAAFTSATGSAGTIAAGDWLKDRYGTLIAAVEAVECPTLLENGFGEHNIQGIGDKHVPLIHNVTNTDLVVGVSDRATDELLAVLNTDAGQGYLADRRGVAPELIARLDALGISSIANIVAAIKVARTLDLGPDEAVVTVATDGAAMYRSELAAKILPRDYQDGFDTVSAAEAFGRHVLGASEDHVLELSRQDRNRIFNLGYYTWVEQQGVPLDEFEARRDQTWWRGLRDLLPAWDAMIEAFNAETGVTLAG